MNSTMKSSGSSVTCKPNLGYASTAPIVICKSGSGTLKGSVRFRTPDMRRPALHPHGALPGLHRALQRCALRPLAAHRLICLRKRENNFQCNVRQRAHGACLSSSDNAH
jgi:hypothetical protein